MSDRSSGSAEWLSPQSFAGVETVAELALLLRELRRREARQEGATPLTYRDLAAKTGWSRGIIGEYFAGRVLPPTDRFDVLVRLLGAGPAEQGLLATARDRVEERRRTARQTTGERRGWPDGRRVPGSGDPPAAGRGARVRRPGRPGDGAGHPRRPDRRGAGADHGRLRHRRRGQDRAGRCTGPTGWPTGSPTVSSSSTCAGSTPPARRSRRPRPSGHCWTCSASARSGSRRPSTRRPRSTGGCWPTGGSWWCSTTPATPTRCARCCPAVRPAGPW